MGQALLFHLGPKVNLGHVDGGGWNGVEEGADNRADWGREGVGDSGILFRHILCSLSSKETEPSSVLPLLKCRECFTLKRPAAASLAP